MWIMSLPPFISLDPSQTDFQYNGMEKKERKIEAALQAWSEEAEMFTE